jgi:hypothetical protein
MADYGMEYTVNAFGLYGAAGVQQQQQQQQQGVGVGVGVNSTLPTPQQPISSLPPVATPVASSPQSNIASIPPISSLPVPGVQHLGPIPASSSSHTDFDDDAKTNSLFDPRPVKKAKLSDDRVAGSMVGAGVAVVRSELCDAILIPIFAAPGTGPLPVPPISLPAIY